MSARFVEIAKDVFDMLNTAKAVEDNFSQAFELRRVYIARHKPRDLEGLYRLHILPSDVISERESKSMFGEENQISLVLQSKPGQGVDETEAMDAHLLLVEEILDFLRMNPLPSGDAAMIGSRFVPLFDEDHLEAYGVLTTVFSVNYKGWSNG